MKAKKFVTGAVAALSLLALAATGALAADVHCSSGTVVATGAGHLYEGTTVVRTNLRSVTLTCAEGDAVNVDWPDGAARTFVIPSSPDKDGIYAAALTALANDGSTVDFYLSNSKVPKAGTPQGLIKLLHVK